MEGWVGPSVPRQMGWPVRRRVGRRAEGAGWPVILAIVLVVGCGEAGAPEEGVAPDRDAAGRVEGADGRGTGGGSRAPGDAPVGTSSRWGPLALSARVRTALEEGNEAFRAGDYDRALEAYRRGVAADSTAEPAWFGVYMVHTALGDSAAARAAYARLASTEPGEDS